MVDSKLRVSRDEAEKKITLQITKGQEILSLLEDSSSYRRGLEKSWVWFIQTIDLVDLLFLNKKYSDEISALAVNSKDQLVALCIAKLKIILEREKLAPISESIKMNTSNSKTAHLPIGPEIFIVHGHDGEAKESAARLVEKLGLHAIILHEQPNAGRTIIEKFEDHSNVGFAVVLLTPDDIGCPQDKQSETKPRARQNVILELGYFMGKLGRGRVCALYKEGVEIPSDYRGVLYIPMDSAGAWRMALAKEIKNAGIDVNLNKL